MDASLIIQYKAVESVLSSFKKSISKTNFSSEWIYLPVKLKVTLTKLFAPLWLIKKTG